MYSSSETQLETQESGNSLQRKLASIGIVATIAGSLLSWHSLYGSYCGLITGLNNDCSVLPIYADLISGIILLITGAAISSFSLQKKPVHQEIPVETL